MAKTFEPFIEGEHYLNLGLLTLAKERFQTALQIADENHDAQGMGVCFFYLIQVAIAEKNKPEAITLLQKARDHYGQRNHSQMLSQLDLLKNEIEKLVEPEPNDEKTSIPIAIPESHDPFELFQQGEINKAIKVLEQDIQRFRQANQPYNLALSLLYLGQCEFTNNNQKLAVNHLKEAEQIAHQLKNQELTEAIQKAFHTIHIMEQEQDIERHSLENLLKNETDLVQKIMLALSKAEIYILKKNVNEAELAIHQARRFIPEKNPEKYLALISLVESKFLRMKNRPEQAVIVLKYAKEFAQKSGADDILEMIQQIENEIK